MDVKLVVVGGKSAGREIPVRAPKFLIGRAEDCQLRPGSDLVSRHHCAILIDEGLAVVRDFGSRNGTFVNDERVRSERELKTGDHLKVGPLEFEVHLSVAVGGKKKPKVHSVGEAAARTAQSTAPLKDDDVDIEGLLGEEDEVVAPAGATETVDLKGSKQDQDTVRTPAPETPGKKTEKINLLSQFSEQKKPTAGNSRDAAAETLRKFLGGRR